MPFQRAFDGNEDITRGSVLPECFDVMGETEEKGGERCWKQNWLARMELIGDYSSTFFILNAIFSTYSAPIWIKSYMKVVHVVNYLQLKFCLNRSLLKGVTTFFFFKKIAKAMFFSNLST